MKEAAATDSNVHAVYLKSAASLDAGKFAIC